MLTARLAPEQSYSARGYSEQYGSQPQYGGQSYQDRAYRGTWQQPGGYYYDNRGYQMDQRQQDWGAGRYYPDRGYYQEYRGYRGSDNFDDNQNWNMRSQGSYYGQPQQYQYQYDNRGPVSRTWGAIEQGTGRVIQGARDLID